LDPSTTSQPHNVVQDAFDQFISSLPKGERSLFKKCDTAEAMIESVRSLETIAKHGNRYRRALEYVKTFSDRVKPFFASLDIIVQSCPEIAGLAWGGMRLVLQVG